MLYLVNKEFQKCHVSENYQLLYQIMFLLIIINLKLQLKGKFGTLQKSIPDVIGIQQDESILRVSLKEGNKKSPFITWFISNT